MQANDSAAEKRTAIEYLDFGPRTAKRVTFEAFEFTIVSPHLVEVTNASYGYLKDEHTYTVGVEERDGVAVPAECDCPADIHREPDCKHKAALAALGGPTVLEAAVAFSPQTGPSDKAVTTTMADKLRADGGDLNQQEGDDDCGCVDSPDQLPCWECYRDGKADL